MSARMPYQARGLRTCIDTDCVFSMHATPATYEIRRRGFGCSSVANPAKQQEELS
jgi:hypothetical protein